VRGAVTALQGLGYIRNQFSAAPELRVDTLNWVLCGPTRSDLRPSGRAEQGELLPQDVVARRVAP
jgi:hypothetical protein